MATNMKSLNGYGFDASALGGHDPSHYATSEDIQQVRNEIPTELPNPNALTFTGAVNETYDGSAAKSVAIPTVPTTLPNPNKLILSGAVTAEYDGSSEVSVEITAGGGSGSYNLPIASATQLGGVMPAAKTDEMTQAVGVDDAGGLWTMAGGGEDWTTLGDVTLTEEVSTVLIDWRNSAYPYKTIRIFAVYMYLVGAEGATSEVSINLDGQWPGLGTDAGEVFGRGVFKTPVEGKTRTANEMVFAFKELSTEWTRIVRYAWYDNATSPDKTNVLKKISRYQGLKFSVSGVNFGVGSRFVVKIKDI